MEVIVTLTIVGIVAAISVPRMYDIGNQNRVHRLSQALQIEVQQAFAVAGRNRAPITFRWNSVTSEFQTTNLAGTTVYRRSSIAGYGLKATEVAMAPTTFTVFPNGLAKDSLIITISRTPYTRSVHVSRAGMVQVK